MNLEEAIRATETPTFEGTPTLEGAEQTTEPDITWGEAGKGFVFNLIPSFGTNAWNVVSGVPGLPKVLWELGKEMARSGSASPVSGRVRGAGLSKERVSSIGGGGLTPENAPILSAIIADYEQRFGSTQGLKRALRDDPFSVLVEFMPALSKAAKAGKLGKLSKGLQIANPEELVGTLLEFSPAAIKRMKVGGPGVGYSPEAAAQAERFLGPGQGTSAGDVPGSVLSDDKNIPIYEANVIREGGEAGERFRQRSEVSRQGIQDYQSRRVGDFDNITEGYDPTNPVAAGDQVISHFKQTQLGKRSETQSLFDELENITTGGDPLDPLSQGKSVLDTEVPPFYDLIGAEGQDVLFIPDPTDAQLKSTPKPKKAKTPDITPEFRRQRIVELLHEHFEGGSDWHTTPRSSGLMYTPEDMQRAADIIMEGLDNQNTSALRLILEKQRNTGGWDTKTLIEAYDVFGMNLDAKARLELFGVSHKEAQEIRKQIAAERSPDVAQPQDKSVIDALDEAGDITDINEILNQDVVNVGYLPYFTNTASAMADLKAGRLLSNKDITTSTKLLIKAIEEAEAGGWTLRDFDQLRTNYREAMDLAVQNNEITRTGSGTVASKMYHALTEDLYNLLDEAARTNPDIPDDFPNKVRIAKSKWKDIIDLESTAAGKWLSKAQYKTSTIVDDVLRSGGIFDNIQNIRDLKSLIGDQGMNDLRPALLARIFDKSKRSGEWSPTGLKNQIANINSRNKNKIEQLFGDDIQKELQDLADFSARFTREIRVVEGSKTAFLLQNRTFMNKMVNIAVLAGNIGYGTTGNLKEAVAIATAQLTVNYFGDKAIRRHVSSDKYRQKKLEGFADPGMLKIPFTKDLGIDMAVLADAIESVLMTRAFERSRTAARTATHIQQSEKRGRKQMTRMGGYKPIPVE